MMSDKNRITISNIADEELSHKWAVFYEGTVQQTCLKLQDARIFAEGMEAGIRVRGESDRTQPQQAAQEEPFGDNESSRFIAGMKGAAARAGGFPKDTNHGYAGRNAGAFVQGWEYVNECLRDPNFKHPQAAPSPAPEGIAYSAMKQQLAQLESRLRELEWVPIDSEHLPKVGDEVACFDGESCVIYEVTSFNALFTASKWINQLGMTHYRPINAPSTAPAQEMRK